MCSLSLLTVGFLPVGLSAPLGVAVMGVLSTSRISHHAFVD